MKNGNPTVPFRARSALAFRWILERGHDVTDVDLLAHAVLSRLQRALQPSHDLARPFPAAGLVQEARIGAQLRLSTSGFLLTTVHEEFAYPPKLAAGADISQGPE